MSPKATNYKANSVIFFQGDQSERVFILKGGKVLLKSNDIETNEEIKEMIQTGEFFGVKSSLGKYPRDETALVLQDADVLVFTVAEFEQLVLANTRIIMKMLRVFSNQLRRIHNKVQNVVQKGDITNPETGLYKIGEYYYNNRQYRQASYAFSRYLTYYPSGVHASQANMKLQDSEQNAISGRPAGSGRGASASISQDLSRDPNTSGEVAPSSGAYYEAVGLLSQEKYVEAYKIFQKIVSTGSDPENVAKSEFEMGRCMVMLKKFDDAIRHFTGLIQKYPKHPDLKEALFYIGKAYEGKQDITWAKSFYEKILNMADEDEPVAMKTRKALRALEGGQ